MVPPAARLIAHPKKLKAGKPTGVITDCMTKKIHSKVEIHVPFHDVDPAGYVWHGHYFKYFEIARCSLLALIGYNYSDMRDSGFFWPIVDTNVRFRRPAVYDQHLEVKASLREWEVRLLIDYIVRDAEGETLVRGHTVQVPVSLEDQEMAFGSPQILLDRVDHYLTAHRND